MSKWRNIGYVPDSEDEGDLETQESGLGLENDEGDELADTAILQRRYGVDQKRPWPKGPKVQIEQASHESVTIRGDDDDDDDLDELAGDNAGKRRRGRPKLKQNVGPPSTPPRQQSPVESLSSEPLSSPPSHLSTPNFTPPPRTAIQRPLLQLLNSAALQVTPERKSAVSTALPISQQSHSPSLEHTITASQRLDSISEASAQQIVRPTGQILVQVVIPSSRPPTRVNEERDRILRNSQMVAQVLENEGTGSIEEEDRGIAMQLQRRGARSLRTRTAMQMHPYRLEDQKYRQTLKARGVRPINIVQPSAAHRENAVQHVNPERNRSGSEAEFSDSSLSLDNRGSRHPLSSSPPRFKPPSSTPPTAPNSRPRVSTVFMDSDDELPDLKDVLRTQFLGSVQRGRKRLKVFSNSNLRRANAVVLQTTSENSIPDQAGSDRFDIAPSTLTSQGSNSPIHTMPGPRAKFIIPPRLAIDELTTPNAYSILREPQPTALSAAVESDSDGPPVSTNRRRVMPISSRSSSASSVASRPSVEPTRQDALEKVLKPFRKRMKGVLPASYIRLEQQAQAGNVVSSPRKRPLSTRSPSKRHGSARESRSTRSASVTSMSPYDRSPTRPVPIVVPSDDSDGRPDVFDLPEDLRIGDAEEHDWIDNMAPSVSRASKPRQRKRQSRLESHGVYKKRLDLDRSGFMDTNRDGLASESTKPRQRKQPVSKSRVVKPSRLKVPKLGILDATRSSALSVPTSPEPDFIRIAKRQARKDPKKGRHSPVQKHLRLRTHDDTEDAQGVLRQWRAGTMAPRSNSEISRKQQNRRQPLQPRSDNQQQQQLLLRLSRPTAKHANAVPANLSNPDRLQESPVRSPRLAQTRLKPVDIHSISNNSSRVVDSGKRIKQRTSARRHVRQPNYRSGQLEHVDAPGQWQDKVRFRKAFKMQEFQLPESAETFDVDLHPQLDRFLHDQPSNLTISGANDATNEEVRQVDATKVREALPSVVLARRPRKLKARRIDAHIRGYRQPSDPPLMENFNSMGVAAVDLTITCMEGQGGLQGLGPYGTRYPTDFDVLPLQSGTFFHSTTFLGSGEFNHCLGFSQRTLDEATSVFHVSFAGQHYRWQAWSESVASEMSACLSTRSRLVEQATRDGSMSPNSRLRLQEICMFLRSMLNYISKHMYFLDPIDRSSFVGHMTTLISRFVEDMILFRLETCAQAIRESLAEQSMLHLSLLSIAIDAAELATVPPTRCHSLLETGCKMLVSEILALGIHQIKGALDDNRYHVKRESGIHSDKVYVEALVVVQHILDHHVIPGLTLDNLIGQILTRPMDHCLQVSVLDHTWQTIFLLQPFGEIDRSGLYQTGKRFGRPLTLWTPVKILLNRTLKDAYPKSLTNTTVNDYIRAILLRVYNLVQNWAWRDSESALAVIFNFFTSKSLAPLPHERYHGSPRFIEDLAGTADFSVFPEENAFHIFLKILAIAFKTSRNVYDDRRLTQMLFRFIPNHDRLHVFDKVHALEQDNLDSLRNHHDVLCLLYWAARSNYRPRFLRLLQELVDHKQSHSAACKVNIRAWSLIARYQFSTDESPEMISPVSQWGQSLIEQTIHQYHLARTEGDRALEIAKVGGDISITEHIVKSTTARNQDEFLALLGDVVSGIRAALTQCNDNNKRRVLMADSGLSNILTLFESHHHRPNAVIVEALAVVRFDMAFRSPAIEATSEQQSEESQDFGDIPDFDELEEVQSSAKVRDWGPEGNDSMTEPLWHLLSNAFGADTAPEDSISAAIIDTWAAHASFLVKSKWLQWESFLENHGQKSWQQLRDTMQTRMYRVYFTTMVLRNEPALFETRSDFFLGNWLISLVERESVFKHQHLLTAELLHVAGSSRELQNLPFVMQNNGERLRVELADVKERRLSILSSVLHNMRGQYEDTLRQSNERASALQQRYALLLREVMATMRKHYVEVQSANFAKGVYVSFVHKVVELLQQHTTEICRIDPFFIDSREFPLPAHDPTYIVGKLKGYGRRLADSKTAKKLAVFLQTALERAAIEQQQDHLVSQLSTAASEGWETGMPDRPTLRCILLLTLFPCYIKISLSIATGWLFARPVLLASTAMYERLLHWCSSTQENSIGTVSSMVIERLALLCRTMELIVSQAGLLEEPNIVQTVGLMFENATAMLPIVDYIQRRTKQAAPASVRVSFLASLGSFVKAQLSNRPDAPESILDDTGIDTVAPAMPDVQAFCTRELNRSLTTNWSRRGDEYFFTTSTSTQAVKVTLGSLAEEKKRLAAAIDSFKECLADMPAFASDMAEREASTWNSWTAELVV